MFCPEVCSFKPRLMNRECLWDSQAQIARSFENWKVIQLAISGTTILAIAF